jgi:hypothetical protein
MTKLSWKNVGLLNTYLFDAKGKIERQMLFHEADGLTDEHYKQKRALLDRFFVTDKSIKEAPKAKIDQLFLALKEWYQGELDHVSSELKSRFNIEIEEK